MGLTGFVVHVEADAADHEWNVHEEYLYQVSCCHAYLMCTTIAKTLSEIDRVSATVAALDTVLQHEYHSNDVVQYV